MFKGRQNSAEARAKMAAAKKGKPMAAETRQKISASTKGERSHRWKNGRTRHGQGYVLVSTDNPNKRQELEHRLVMAGKLGRELLPTEVVHHIDGDKTNNDEDNLVLFESHKAHVATAHPIPRDARGRFIKDNVGWPEAVREFPEVRP